MENREAILACIVTYNPDLNKLENNIARCLEQLNFLIIIDNNSKNKEKIINLISEKFKNKVYIILNNDNKGIASALNTGLKYGDKKNYKWLLTLDQDSIIYPNMISKYNDFLGDHRNKKIGILTCNIFDEKDNLDKKKLIANYYESVMTAITSGSLINIKGLVEIGGFDEQLFIDYVDFDVSLKFKKNNYEIIKICDTGILHNLGDMKTFSFFNKKIIVTNHNPLRRYYMYRNKCIIYKRYFKNYPKWVIRDSLSGIKTIILILVFEKQKILKIKSIFKGIREGIKLNYS